MRGHVTTAAVGFVGPFFLLELPSSSHAAESERIRTFHFGPGHLGTQETARIPINSMGLLTGSLVRDRLSEFPSHHLARAGGDQGGRHAAD
jgi:hypothetical protein